ncbi:uncharacterized protein LOC123653896 [Melitaea cinxia]|uniref:uncharacterized protein LOC123653896 n=1 Tax=Melitaea cinxia TaxID=113334 RepID=UPI001E272E95|nr:uncharacterized protein LOC123653896 [Melitaea cinxia]
MYIALKWLISLVLVMWLVLCFLDVYRKTNFTQQIEMHQERKNFSKLLISGNQEIQTTGIRDHLETEIKNKDDLNEVSKEQLKETRSTNTSFQQLYLVIHQENIFLKLRIKKLIKEKEEAERKLIKLISQVIKSKNNDLKVYCSQFIVHTKNNLLNSDVKTEIEKFLRKRSDDVLETDKSYDQITGHSNFGCLSIKCNEFIEDKTPAVRNTPIQCGEYVWTVKDKDGVIEKLYECAGDFYNGDPVKRIRQYSVYYDTECLLDFSNSTTFVNNQDAAVSNTRNKYPNFKLTVTNRKFLSSSQAFKNFLQNNNSIVKQVSRSSNSTNIWLNH